MIHKKPLIAMVAIVVSFVCSLAQAATFFPLTTDHLILHINIANGNGENDVIDLGGRTFKIVKVNNNDAYGFQPTGLPIIRPDGIPPFTHALTIKNGRIERDLSVPNLELGILFNSVNATLSLENVVLRYGFLR